MASRLTTVVTAIEDVEEFERFEAAIRADYQPVSAIEHELVARLASLLWRLRRAALIETNLFQLHGDYCVTALSPADRNVSHRDGGLSDRPDGGSSKAQADDP